MAHPSTDVPLSDHRRSVQRAGALVLLAAALVILAALGFEYIGGYAPCPLCLQQRYAYYLALPLLALALASISFRRSGSAALLFGVVALAFLANAGLGIYHAGAEWKLWRGPESCTAGAPLSTNAGNLLSDLATTRVVPCEQPAIRVLGLSLAAWNAFASIALAGGSAWAAAASASRR
jgi:disulfide bond formation protein DsbB